MTCTHPDECHEYDEDGFVFCNWCEEVKDLKQQVAALFKELGKQAIVVSGGQVDLECDSVGYMLVTGGTVNLGRVERVPFMNLI